MAVAGLSTLGITFGYGTESTAGNKPSTFTQLTRINQIGAITLENQQIDASALEDFITKNIAGRADTPGNVGVKINLTDATKTEWETLISTYKALTGGKQMWFEIIIPGITEAYFFIAQPPQEMPSPEIGQNELLTVEMSLTIVDVKAFDTAVSFS